MRHQWRQLFRLFPLVLLFLAAASRVSTASGVAYVSNNGGNTVTVINADTNTVIGAVTVGVAPAGMAATPDGSLLYVANSGSDSVSVIATKQRVVVATVLVGIAPAAVAMAQFSTTITAEIAPVHSNTSRRVVTDPLTSMTAPITISEPISPR